MVDLATVTESIQRSCLDAYCRPPAPEQHQLRPPSTEPPPRSIPHSGISNTKHNLSPLPSAKPAALMSKVTHECNTPSRTYGKAAFEGTLLMKHESPSDAHRSSTQAEAPPTHVKFEQATTFRADVDFQSASRAQATNNPARPYTSGCQSVGSTAFRSTPVCSSSPRQPSRLVSTPGAKKPKWYAVVVGRRTGVFDDW
jgi:hypothetical protein